MLKIAHQRWSYQDLTKNIKIYKNLALNLQKHVAGNRQVDVT